jgi:glucose-6-phosphate 1-dehydrogenase
MLKSDACVIFGGTGDLALRMLLPSLYYLEAENRFDPTFRIIGIAREALSRDAFARRVRDALDSRVERASFDEAVFDRLAARLDYVGADVTQSAGVERLKAAAGDLKAPLYYCATSPGLFGPICAALGAAGLAGEHARVVMEKPVGRDLATSRATNEAVGQVFRESQIFRIDHYLGKETVQNLLALRFANTLFEPLWNNLTIEHVQITVAETDGVGDRWRYYDDYGAARDMLQNHMLQLLALVAMEPPSDMSAEAVRNEKVKVLRSMRPITAAEARRKTVRGQYGPGVVDGVAVRGYADERGQATGTETFVALEAEIDNWRWAGVPFFLRTGKRLPKRRTVVVVQFKPVPHSIFGPGSEARMVANRLMIDLQPQENIELLLMNKAPGVHGGGTDLQPLPLSLSLRNAFGGQGARRRIAYERLLLDAINGVQTLFVSREEVEQAWAWIDGIAEAWDDAEMEPLPYVAGSWGPTEAKTFIETTGRRWDD